MADLKITELAALTTVLGEDLLAIVDDPTGTASTKKIRTDDFQSGWHVGARVYNDAAISISDGVTTTLTFNSERYDTDTIHDTSTNTNRLTCKTAGKYLIIGNVEFEAAVGGSARQIQIMFNNSVFIAIQGTYNASASGFPNAATRLSISTIYELAVDEYVEIKAYQLSGGALNVTASGNFSPAFSMHKIG